MKKREHTLFIPILAILLATPLVTPVTAMADEFQSLDAIRDRAREFAASQIGGEDKNTVIEPGHLDPRLHLPRCPLPLTAELLGQRHNGPNLTVTIKCQGRQPWSIHVPVKTAIYAQVLVADRPLPRGVAIQAADLRSERRETAQLRLGYYDNAGSVVGRIPKRSINQGAAITPGDLELNRIIQRGSKVTIVASSGGITIRMQGKALEDGAEGESIKVENSSSKRVIEAVALRPGVVEVQM